MLYNPPNEILPNVDLNELSSRYAADYGHDTSFLVQRVTNKDIFDAEPQQFLDLKLLNMKTFEQELSDEFNYIEETYFGDPIQATGGVAGVTYPNTQSFVVSTLNDVSTDIVIVYPNNARGTVTAIDSSTNTITVTPMTGSTLPAVTAGDLFSHLSTIDGNRADGFPAYFRPSYINRYNYIQSIAYAVTFTKKEMYKFEKAGTIDNYVARARERMMRILRTRVSNVFWNGERGEVTLRDNQKEKTTGGVEPTMVAAGSPTTTTTVATLRDAFEDIVESTEFGPYGEVRFAFMDSRYHRILSQAYKGQFTRYTPTDTSVTSLLLNTIDIGSSKVVPVPYPRFKQRSSFPASFANSIYVLDLKNINLKQLWGETSGETLDRSGGVAKTYKDIWVETQIGLKFNNPLACGKIIVS